MIAALIRGEQRRRRHAVEKMATQRWSERIPKHPLGAWLLENTCCFVLAAAANILVPKPNSKASAFAVTIAGTAIMQWGSFGLMQLLVQNVYKSIPTFSEPGRPQWS